MKPIFAKLALAAILPLALSACGGGSNSIATPPATVGPTSFQDKFGTAFATDFNASSTANAADPAPTDVPALNLTAEPLDN